MPYKLLKVLANTLAIIKISSISLIGYSNTFICVAIWQISTISPYFWLIGSKRYWHLLKFHYFHHKIPHWTMLHTSIVSYVWSNTNISTILPIFWLIGNKSNGFYEILSFSSLPLAPLIHKYCVLCMVKHIVAVISPLVWLVGCKCRGNYRNFNNFPSINCCLVHIVKPSV